MKNLRPEEFKIEGKTYSLFGDSGTTDGYYQIVELLADKILEKNPDIASVIEMLTSYSAKKRYLTKITRNKVKDIPAGDWIRIIDSELQQFTANTGQHLKTLHFTKRFDRGVATTREQYHLYMLEIELTNRMNSNIFKSSDRKIALTPYCLQDFSANCRAAKKGFDYQCKKCSSSCFQNHASTIMEKNKIEPYIWREASIKEIAKTTSENGESLGILGIACIPELVNGMRKCRKYKIPVVGIPLNANRCMRWFGEFLPNSINLEKLQKLVS
jgi:hypothetical protein